VGNDSTYNFPVRIKVLYKSWNTPFPPFRDEETGRYYPQMQKYIDILKEFEQEGLKLLPVPAVFTAIQQETTAAESRSINRPYSLPFRAARGIFKTCRGR
jgi:hypothetical protein